jgi:hypothetical protein
VIALDEEGDLTTRSGEEAVLRVQVGVRQAVDMSLRMLDALADFMDELRRFCLKRRLATTTPCTCFKVSAGPVCDLPTLAEKKVFLSVMTLSFRTVRDAN